MSIPRITRKTEKGLPGYTDQDVFVLSGSEDLVPVRDEETFEIITKQKGNYLVTTYRPRTEGLFAGIECWGKSQAEVFWKVTTKQNITSIYGKTPNARLADPKDSGRISQWMLQETFDTKGNHIYYEYAHDKVPDHAERRYTQCYLRRVLYGNTPDKIDADKCVGPERTATDHLKDDRLKNRHYLFELLFDYGDIPRTIPADYLFSKETESNVFSNLTERKDAFSQYRSRFEIRTRYRCERILMLHHFAEQEVAQAPLVKSLDLHYEYETYSAFSMLTSAILKGYAKRGRDYIVSDMPPLSFAYSVFEPEKQRYRTLETKHQALPAKALNDRNHVLFDVYGNGLPDILHTTDAGYFHWENLGEGNLSLRRPQPHASVPAGVKLSDSNVAVADIGGDGLPELIVNYQGLTGFYEAASDGNWKPFQKLENYPVDQMRDPNLRMVDLTGDGLADILITGDNYFIWYRSLGEQGFANPQFIARQHDLNLFPDVFFNDPAGRVRLADMTGDGLADIVLAHDGRIEYWPNLGHGRFGSRIVMQNTPLIGPDYDPKQLLFADIDGTGCADMIYVENHRIRFWFNQSGNRWSDECVIKGTPPIHDLTAVQCADILGTGTTSLMWSYDQEVYPGKNYKFIDFCNGKKPHLLIEMANNLGTTTKVHYAASTKFFLEDKEKGLPWPTPLPFPVQVLEKSETIDHISKTKLVTTYKYHHGYYDAGEREFRGFGRVDQFDTEIFENFTGKQLHDRDVSFDNNKKCFHLPPVETRTWHHTGIYFDPERSLSLTDPLDYHKLMEIYEAEFYQGDGKAFPLQSFRFDQASGNDPREVFRAVRGAVIRSEVYSRDHTQNADKPYLVTHNSYDVQTVQPSGRGTHGVYLTALKETLSYHYERNPADPRVGHQINLKTDAFGNVTDSVTIGYPRREPQTGSDARLEEQKQLSIVYTHADYINQDNDENAYFIGVPYQTKVFEVTGMEQALGNNKPIEVSQFPETLFDTDEYKPYLWERPDTQQGIEKRLIDWKRDYFRKNIDPEEIDPVGDLSHRLELGNIESLGLPYESYQAAFTPEMLETIYGPERLDLIASCHKDYSQEDGMWWIPSGRQGFSQDYFYQPIKTQDAFGYRHRLTLDGYGLLLTQRKDPLNNSITAVNNYRVLKPDHVVDINDVKSFAAYDALGMMVGMAVQGKHGEGDSLSGFEPDLSSDQIRTYIDDPYNSDQTGNTHHLLCKANTRFVYDLHRYIREGKPVVVSCITRITHDSDMTDGEKPDMQLNFVYSDGFGRKIQTKVQAEPGEVIGQYVSKRWTGTGWKVFNNKNKSVQEFEPFFSTTHEFEANVIYGISPVIFYDPMLRVIATLQPNHTYEKVLFSPWRQKCWDCNDTVLLDPREDDDVKEYIRPYLDIWEAENGTSWKTWYELALMGNRQQKQAAEQTKQHNNTPAIVCMDHRGRTITTIADNGSDDKPETRVILDIEGNERKVIDPRKIENFKHIYDLAGRKLAVLGKDAGLNLMFPNTRGKPVLTWDGNETIAYMKRDELGRQLELWVKIMNIDMFFLAEKTIYGEKNLLELDDGSISVKDNFRGQVWKTYDGAGLVENRNYDFKGNLLHTQRTLLKNGKDEIKWIKSAFNLIDQLAIDEHELDAFLDTNKAFDLSTEYDALNRVICIDLPDNTKKEPVYNEAGLLNTVWITQPAVARKKYVENIDYNAKGQRKLIKYGNGVVTTYEYDELTFLMEKIKTTRRNGAGTLQELYYTYDPVGNITHIKDDAHKTIFNHNDRIEPISRYIYDPLYRLIRASGREHNSMTKTHYQHGRRKHTEFIPLTNQPVNNGRDLGNYEQQFEYDASGNLTLIKHKNKTTNKAWQRRQTFSNNSNRILESNSGDPLENSPIEHDANGNIIMLPHMKPKDPEKKTFTWDFKNQLRAAILNNADDPDMAYYQYDAAGKRVRKTIVKQGITEERLYLGGYEVYIKSNGTGPTFRRDTVYVMDNKERIALIEIEKNVADESVKDSRVRFQLSNHLGSALMEVDGTDKADLISYEEYYAYGETAYMAGESQRESITKHYRYSGKERDDETGLYYYGARYYAPWMGRWMSADPIKKTSLSSYMFNNNNPICFIDTNGLEGEKKTLPLGCDDNDSGSSDYSEYEPSSSNLNLMARGIGSLQIMGGGVEMYTGATGLTIGISLLLIPEPSITKAAALIILGLIGLIHGADMLSTGLLSLSSGKLHHTITYEQSYAYSLSKGLSENSSFWIAGGVDFFAGTAPTLGLGFLIPIAVNTTNKANLTLSYKLFNATKEKMGTRIQTYMGHNVVGTNYNNKLKLFDFIDEGSGAVWRNYPGSLEHYSTVSIPVSSYQARSALLYAEYTMPQLLANKSFQFLGPNCTTAASAVLTAGGVSVPFWAISPKLLYYAMKYPWLSSLPKSVLSGTASVSANTVEDDTNKEQNNQ